MPGEPGRGLKSFYQLRSNPFFFPSFLFGGVEGVVWITLGYAQGLLCTLESLLVGFGESYGNVGG